MPITTKSLRQYLQGHLVDFAESCDMAPLVSPTTLTSLIVALADLREEGTILIPEVFLCEDLDEILKLLPGSQKLPIGEQTDPAGAIAEALKKCAPLAIGGWCMYIASNQQGIGFGLFRGSLNPLSISITQTLFSHPLESIKVVRLFRTASGCVELTNHTGDVFSMLLNDKPDTVPLPQAYTTDLVALICHGIRENTRESARTYLEKTIRAALAVCHGTIIVVVPRRTLPKFLSDGVVLASPLNISRVIRQVFESDSNVSAEHALVANAALIKGMISSDGITVFDSFGNLLAYNCFIASPNKTPKRAIVGGARTRAYEVLKAKVGKGQSFPIQV